MEEIESFHSLGPKRPFLRLVKYYSQLLLHSWIIVSAKKLYDRNVVKIICRSSSYRGKIRLNCDVIHTFKDHDASYTSILSALS